MNNKSKYALPLLFALAHCFFLYHLYEQSGSTTYFLYLLLLPFYYLIPFKHSELDTKETGKIVLMFLIGSMGTQFIDLWFNNKVISSCIVACLSLMILNPKKHNNLLLALYAGTFTGMTANHYLAYSDLSMHIICAATGGLSFTLLSKSLPGFGGKLGSLGFAALIPIIILQSI